MAQVSGIEVRFSGNTTELEKSVGRAQGVISGFAKTAAASLAGALSVGMFVSAGRAALNFADDIGKMAQKVGMTTEALSKLTYAAKLSDVSMQELQIGVQQLSKNMEAGSEGLAALGISATDASGNLRSTAEVFADVAEAFANMEDGAGKTAIAMNIFGRSGAQLIPMLNSGRRGLNEMGDEAKRLGVVVSGDAAEAAEDFNDNLTRLQTAVNGLSQALANRLAKPLNDVLEALLEYVAKGDLIQQAIDGIASEFADLSRIITASADGLDRLGEWSKALDNFAKSYGPFSGAAKNGFFGAFPGSASQDPTGSLASIDAFGQQTVNRGGKGDLLKPSAPGLGGSGGSGGSGGRGGSGESSPIPGIPGVDVIDPFFIERLTAIQEGFQTEREVLAEEYAMNQDVLKGALENQLLTEQEYHALSEKLAQDHAKALSDIQYIGLQNNLDAASDFFGSMARIAELGGKKTTKIAKVFGIAQALISTFQGAAKALTLPFPANMAAYASVLAQGMTAVASIRKVNDNGGSNSIGGGSRGGAAASGGDGGGGGRGGGGPTTTFSFTLMNDPMGFGEKFARQFIDQLNSTQRNGGQIRGVIA
jgi:hypothetical protein